MCKLVIPAWMRVSSAMDGKLKPIHGDWIPAQICLEQICINPKGVRQDSLTWIPAGMTILEHSDHVIWQSRIKVSWEGMPFGCSKKLRNQSSRSLAKSSMPTQSLIPLSNEHSTIMRMSSTNVICSSSPAVDRVVPLNKLVDSVIFLLGNTTASGFGCQPDRHGSNYSPCWKRSSTTH